MSIFMILYTAFTVDDASKVSNVNALKTRIIEGLTTYSKTTDVNKFGARFKYSKALNIIDDIDTAITSNITRVKIRRNLRAVLNSFAQY